MAEKTDLIIKILNGLIECMNYIGFGCVCFNMFKELLVLNKSIKIHMPQTNGYNK